MTLKEKNIFKNIKFRKKDVKKNNKILKSLKKKEEKLINKYIILKNIEKEKINKIKLRLDKDLEIIYKFSLEKYFINLLPIIDSLEMAFKNIKNSNDLISKKLYKNNCFLLNILTENNVSIIDKINVPFDPTIHQAIFLKNSKKIKKNNVIEVLQKGYLLNNRLLRAAMVSVSKNLIKN
ncbi:MAG: nucleotide exchange factor GrpE [Buchnera aphidicola (Periphyllus lyropictus)]|uniref:nucleotide exchange factor GrpE n=1 Tax=Buchnera aphidicola TaxID=9 RepID=UPI001EB6BE8F|nr:nucleotide exchange factor GrpE [Buchnera aphidicola]NIH16624.1 nucleotide exchange factor GrpE [Buchnera aphidicola (Periphyllus lyropictus)]USS94536.1 nucleotide exchange factor GrpE [Buchnera aphidicola (Periphyllus lyropictus)]